MFFVILKKSHIFSFYIHTWFNFVPVFLLHPVKLNTYMFASPLKCVFLFWTFKGIEVKNYQCQNKKDSLESSLNFAQSQYTNRFSHFKQKYFYCMLQVKGQKAQYLGNR